MNERPSRSCRNCEQEIPLSLTMALGRVRVLQCPNCADVTSWIIEDDQRLRECEHLGERLAELLRELGPPQSPQHRAAVLDALTAWDEYQSASV